jgi:hypothetical protein
MTRITRVEIIDGEGRSYVNWNEDNDIVTSIQDDGKTLKVFVNKVKPKTGEEGALEALEKFQNDWLLGKKCPETKLEIKNLNSVESIKAEIKLLQKKLDLLEEIEKQPKSLFEFIHNLGYSIDCSWEIVDAVEDFLKSKGYPSTLQRPETLQERGDRIHKEMEELVNKLQEKNREIKAETDYLIGKVQHKTKIADKDGNDYKSEPITNEELLKSNWEPKPQEPEEQKFKEIPELLDQLDALMETYPLPTVVWRDIRKLMFLSYDKGYSKGGYDTHMKYAGTD